MDNKAKEDFWAGRRIMITGSAGFLGCWLSGELAEKGAKVTGLDIELVPKSNFYYFKLNEKIKQLHIDIRDCALLQEAIAEYAPEFILHLAAQPLVTVARDEPIRTFEHNIKGTWNLLEAARKARGITGLIVASSDKAYGIHEKLPYDEDAKLQGSFPYDVSKSAADLIAQCYHKTYGLPVTITRSGNYYGGGDLHFDRIVPGTIKSLLFNEKPVIRSDGKYKRDYIYIKDAVLAHLCLLQNLKNVAGQAFNFSNEFPIDVITLVNKIAAILDKTHLQPEILNQAKTEIKEQYLSSKKARDLLGWRPSYNLDAGLAETIDWYKMHFEVG